MRRALAIAACLAVLPAPAAPLLVPQPASMQAGEGVLRLDPHGAIGTGPDADSRQAAKRLRSLLRATTGLALALHAGDGAATIQLRLEPAAALGKEGYRIESTTRGVTVTAATRAGLNHAASTLVQLAARSAEGVTLPVVTIEDAPRFPWRGLMVDSARHFQSAAYLRGFLDWMALHKLNVLHWHLTDDQGWRLPIARYPRLATRGSVGGHYSRDDVRMLVAHAESLGITIVPEIDMPGHATAALVAYPRLAAIDAPPRRVPGDWGIYPNVYSLDESTFAFIEDVLREVMALFPGRYIHVGGDEVIKDQWLSPRGRERMRALGIDDPAKLQPYFTQRIGRFLAANGRRLVGWDEILEPGLDRDAVVMSWRGTAGALEAAKRGYDTVLAAHPTLYFDNRQSAREEEPPGRVTTIGVDDVYAFDPMPAGLTPEQSQHVLGVQGNLWTEHIRTEGRLAIMAFPRAAAVAELGWAPAASRDAASFRIRLDAMMRLYPAVGLGEAARLEQLRRSGVPGADALRRTSRQLKLCSQGIPLMLEDDAPATGPRAVFTLDIQAPCWIFPAAPLDRVRGIRARVGQVPFNFQIGEDVKKIRFAAPTTKEGELEVHAATCDGPLLARLPLAPAVRSNGVTTLPLAPLQPQAGAVDLCFRFAQPALEPMWALDAIELVATP